MIDKLIDVILQFADDLKCWQVVDYYERGMRLRFGKKYGEALEPGIHWKIPFVDNVLSILIKPTTMRLPEQTVTTLDGFSVVVKSIIKYSVSDPVTLMLEVNDPIDAVADMTQGIIRNTIIDTEYNYCNNVEFNKAITTKVRAEAKKWGVAVDVVTITDFGKMMSIRLLNTSIIPE
jgi:regulator of protease activity HflC (stomatin/prohibitin superfamily)